MRRQLKIEELKIEELRFDERFLNAERTQVGEKEETDCWIFLEMYEVEIRAHAALQATSVMKLKG